MNEYSIKGKGSNIRETKQTILKPLKVSVFQEDFKSSLIGEATFMWSEFIKFHKILILAQSRFSRFFSKGTNWT